MDEAIVPRLVELENVIAWQGTEIARLRAIETAARRLNEFHGSVGIENVLGERYVDDMQDAWVRLIAACESASGEGE